MTDRPEPTDQEILDALASWLVVRRLAVPAILFLETHRPVAFLGSQAMIAASPVVHVFETFFQAFAGPAWRHELYRRFAEIVEDRANVERLIVAIERKSQEQRERERRDRAEQKARARASRTGGLLGRCRSWCRRPRKAAGGKA